MSEKFVLTLSAAKIIFDAAQPRKKGDQHWSIDYAAFVVINCYGEVFYHWGAYNYFDIGKVFRDNGSWWFFCERDKMKYFLED